MCSPTTTPPPWTSPKRAGDTDQAAELEAPALRFLTLAGDRALGLDTAAALANFEHALALTPPGHPDRAAALVRFGEAARTAARYTDAADALEEAITLLPGGGDLPQPHRHGSPSSGAAALGDPRHLTLTPRAVALLEPLPPSPELVDALTDLAADEWLQGRLESAIDYARPGPGVADQLGLDPPARALGYRGGPAPAWVTGPGWPTTPTRSPWPPPPGRAATSPCSTTTTGSPGGCSTGQLRRWTPCTPASPTPPPAASPTYPTPRRPPVAAVRHRPARPALATAPPTSPPSSKATGDMVGPGRGAGRTDPASTPCAANQTSRRLADWLETTTARSGGPQIIVFGFAAAAGAHAALDQPDTAAALLCRGRHHPRHPQPPTTPLWFPGMVRTALAIDRPTSPNNSPPGSNPATPTPNTP